MTTLRDLAVLREPERADNQQLGELLQILRQGAKLSLMQFAYRTGLRISLLRQVESGTVFPPRETLHAYLQVCAAEDHERHLVRKLWERGHDIERHARLAPYTTGVAEEWRIDSSTRTVTVAEGISTVKAPKSGPRRAPTRSGVNPSMWPNPSTIVTREQWMAGLAAIKNSSGLSYAAIAETSLERGYPLARSSVHSLCTKAKLPASADTVREFVTVCGGTDADANAWQLAWQRLKMANGIPVLPEHADRTEVAGIEAGSVVVAETEDVIDPATQNYSRPDYEQPGIETSSSIAPPCRSWWAGSIEVRLSVPIGLMLFTAGIVVGAVLAH